MTRWQIGLYMTKPSIALPARPNDTASTKFRITELDWDDLGHSWGKWEVDK